MEANPKKNNNQKEEIEDPYKDCVNGKLNCFHDKKVCSHAPCELSKFKFGTHERIISFYLKKKKWNNAYYYFEDFLYLFRINCDVSQVDLIRREKEAKNKTMRIEDLPLGCRIFKISNELRSTLTILIDYKKAKKKAKKNNTKISKQGLEQYKTAKVSFRKRLIGNIKLLGHLVMDIENKRYEKDVHFNRATKFLELTIELVKKYGESVDVPNIIEDAFNEASKGAGFGDKAIRQLKNIGKLKDAKRKALITKIQDEFKKNGDISEETKTKFRELMKEND